MRNVIMFCATLLLFSCSKKNNACHVCSTYKLVSLNNTNTITEFVLVSDTTICDVSNDDLNAWLLFKNKDYNATLTGGPGTNLYTDCK